MGTKDKAGTKRFMTLAEMLTQTWHERRVGKPNKTDPKLLQTCGNTTYTKGSGDQKKGVSTKAVQK